MNGLPNYTNIFRENLSENFVTGEWCDVPGERQEGNMIGGLTLRVVNNCRMEKVKESFRYGRQVWSRLSVDYNRK
jgi:hypothetical protein